MSKTSTRKTNRSKRPSGKGRRLNSQQRADAIANSVKDHLQARGDDHLDRRSGLVLALVNECCDGAESAQHAVQEITMAQQTLKSQFEKTAKSEAFQHRFRVANVDDSPTAGDRPPGAD